jgi:hypothetical protein
VTSQSNSRQSLHRSGFRFLAASTRLTRIAAEISSASQIRNSVSRVGDFRFRSSWLMYGRDRPALTESYSWVDPASSRIGCNSPPTMGRKLTAPVEATPHSRATSYGTSVNLNAGPHSTSSQRTHFQPGSILKNRKTVGRASMLATCQKQSFFKIDT